MTSGYIHIQISKVARIIHLVTDRDTGTETGQNADPQNVSL